MCSSCYVFLLFDELQFFGKFYPFVLAGDLYGAALELAQEVGAVVADDEFGIEVFGAIVVYHLQRGLLAVCADINAGDNPYAGVGRLLQVAISVAENLLPGNGNRLFVKVQTQEDIVFIIGNDALERPARHLLSRCGTNDNVNDNDN